MQEFEQDKEDTSIVDSSDDETLCLDSQLDHSDAISPVLSKPFTRSQAKSRASSPRQF